MATELAIDKAARLIDELIRLEEHDAFDGIRGIIGHSPAAKALETSTRDEQAAAVTVALERLGLLESSTERPTKPLTEEVFDLLTYFLIEFLRSRRKLPLGAEEVTAMLRWFTAPRNGWSWCENPLPAIVTTAEHYAESGPMAESVREEMNRLVGYLRQYSKHLRGFGNLSKLTDRLVVLLTGGLVLTLEPGEAWSDAALSDLAEMKPEEHQAWDRLLSFCQTAEGANPKEKWLQEAAKRVEAVGFPAFRERLKDWFPLVDKPRTQPYEAQNPYLPDQTNLLIEPHVNLLKGLVWCCGMRADRDLARALVDLSLSAYRKIPGRGPRLVTLGNACVLALGMMPGFEAVGSLALLKVKVKFGTAQKGIDKALTVAATREGIPREEIEELGVPAYGMEDVGRRREEFGEYTAEFVVDGSEVELRWFKADGKPLKSVPAAVKKDHADELKELQAAVKDVDKMLSAQRERLDGLFLARKQWPYPTWRERYLDHPLMGTIARRLIWSFTSGDTISSGIGPDGQIVSCQGEPLEGLGADTTVSLWHPIGHSVDDVLAWRGFLEEREIRQPFKQAHREVYVLTDAERQTQIYSNRFAAHILRQHQFHALCGVRGWKNTLRLMVDDSYPPAFRLLPEWGLRAEFWIEGVGDNYGQDTMESGAFLYLSTDQVRFRPLDSEMRYAHASGGGYYWTRNAADTGTDASLMLEDVPPLVFSEIMRDVDLFVGVASVGNDPNWSDGGPQGRYRDYWQNYSFGDLSATAQTRKAVLERVVPRLKIADRCSFVDRFLVVRGDLRTYKIHLGSGNILMEPNNQYLCIVPKQSVAAGSNSPVFLPFEGDNMLSIILSKALLLADDLKIKDETITRQIRENSR